jgi:hypothetical protein
MFVQVIQGQVSDAGQLKAAMDRWTKELAPGATGWLGSTAGVTDAGWLVALARFESEEAAQRNSQRPEQDAWWSETAGLFSGPVTFQNSTHVSADTHGNPDDAGFVQIMQGMGKDPDRARELMENDPTDWETFRPDILGTLSIQHDEGAWTMAIYFTSEAAAREGEQKPPPPEVQKMMEELNSLMIGEPTFADLKDPWLSSPG